MVDQKLDKLEVRELIIKNEKNPDGDITLSALQNGVGLWLTQGERTISIYNLKNEVAIGIYNNTKKDKALTIAVSLTKDGEAKLQVVNAKGEIKELDMDEL